VSKRPSEAAFGRALRDVDLSMYVYRPPDPKSGEGVSNWKPCDFMAWHKTADAVHMSWSAAGKIEGVDAAVIAVSTWFECKDTDAVDRFPFADIRPSQLAGIRDAARMGIPYWLAIWWRRHSSWTISNAIKLLEWRHEQETLPHRRPAGPTSVERTLLMSRFGTQSNQTQLTSNLKAVLLGEVD